MSMSDPIADMLTRIRNAQMRREGAPWRCRRRSVKVAIAKVLKDEGYIDDFAGAGRRRQAELEIALRVLRGPPGHRAHRAREPPGLRIYKARDDDPEGHERPGRRHRHHVARA